MSAYLKVHPATSEEQAMHGANLRVEIDRRLLTDGDASQVIPLFNVKAKMGVRLVKMVMPEAFDSSDASLISTTMEIGDGGDTDRFLTSTELNVSGTEVFLKGGALSLSAVPYVYTGDDTVDAKFDCTATYLLNTHTQGKLVLYFQLDDAR